MNGIRRRSAIALVVATVSMSGLATACSSNENETPTPTPTSSSATPPSPTEKGVTRGGVNSFSPTVKAPPAPTAIPGDN